MEIKHRFSLNVSGGDYQEIVVFLDTNNIKYELSTGIPILTVEIFESSPYWSELYRLMKKYGRNSLVEKVFTNKEINEAEWLSVHCSWRWEYPQPEVKYKQITYDGQYCNKCGCGLIQNNPFQIKKQPKWGKRNFLMLNWVEDEIFVSEDVLETFNNQHISGIEFSNVIGNKDKKPINNIWQMKVLSTLKKGLITVPDDIREVKLCTECESEKLILNGSAKLKFDRSIFPDGVDIVKSNEKFGSGLVCASLILISKRVYQIIKNNKWSRDFVFVPVEMV